MCTYIIFCFRYSKRYRWIQQKVDPGKQCETFYQSLRISTNFSVLGHDELKTWNRMMENGMHFRIKPQIPLRR